MDDWVKYFCWYDNIWLDVYVKYFYNDNASKLNSKFFLYLNFETSFRHLGNHALTTENFNYLNDEYGGYGKVTNNGCQILSPNSPVG